MSRTAYTAQIQKAAADHDLDADLFEALVLTESSGHADAFRFEPQYAQRYHIAEHPVYKQWPVRAVAASYGLTQIMVPTAYELGWRDPEPEYLFIPEVNLYWGGVYLKACFDWTLRWPAASESSRVISALAAYNGGRNSANTPLQTHPRNAAYAAKVLHTATTLA